MKPSRVFVLLLALVFCILVPITVYGQGASTAAVTGTITDPKGASVPDATVELLDPTTSITTTVATGADGGYLFPAVPPGTYKVTITARGFRQAVVSNVRVEVGKSALVNVVMELGQITQTVEVTAGTGVELQTLNSSMGDVLDSKLLANLPSLTRDATALMLLEPTAIPGFNGPGGKGEGNASGGGIAGARMDQNTFLIDGGDATSNMEGGGGYNTGFVATPRAVIPTPVESLEEFRVQTNNQGADFTRSVGGEVQMVTIRGTNNWHGSGYWYHQNDELNANDWFRNKRQQQNPEWRDNRYGGKLGGPIWKNRTFFFLFEEERHFFTQATFQRLVPTASLRAGILKFDDAANASNAVRAYNLNPVATLDPSAGPSDNDPRAGSAIPTSGINGTTACDMPSVGCSPLDPRGIGISSAILAEWAKMPLPNDFTGGDGLNSAFFTAAEGNITNEHDAVVRLDHKISNKWDFMGSYRFSTSSVIPPNIQEDISGTASGCQKGVPCALGSRPLQPRYLVAGLTGRLTPSLVNEFHFNWLRHWWSWVAPGAKIPVIPSSESDTRLQIWSESQLNGMVPINMDTQHARERVWNGQDYTYSDNLNWIKGRHIWNFGGRVQRQNLYHVRDDKMVGGITTPIYSAVRGGQFLDIGGVPVPTTNVASADRSRFKQAYISTLGMIDQATQVLTRDANLNPQAPGTNIFQREIVDAYEMYFGDTWHLKPSFTFTWGLTWGVQMPPYDPNGKTTMMIDTSSGQIIDGNSLLNARSAAGLSGNVVNPTVGYVPIRATGRKYPYDPDYSNFGPRLAAAWNPSFTDGALGKLFGNQKTVFRGGWSRAFERKNGVGLVLTPALGLGFGDLSACIAPNTKGVCGAGGNPTTNFRIGSNADGNHITIPSLPVVSGGVIIPGTSDTNPIGATVLGANSGFEPKDDRLDPKLKVGSSDSIDFSIQRELPGKMILEVGYIFRKARDLYGNIDLNSVPYMFTPKGTGQSWGSAFDSVMAALNNGVLPLITNPADPSGKTLVQNPAFKPQPALEALFGGLGSPICSGASSVWGSSLSKLGMLGSFGSCTQAVAQYDQLNGNPYWPAHGAGALFTELEQFLATGPWLASNTQVGAYDWTMSNTFSNYNAGFVTLRSRDYHGLTFDANYTLSHSLDNQGLTQECTGIIPDAYYPRRSYAPSLFDRRHTFNLLVNYELPLGRGKSFATHGTADRVLGGWAVSGIYTVASGLPDMVWDDAACSTEFGSQAANGNDQGLIPIKSGVITETRNNNPTITSSYGKNSTTNHVPNAFGNPDAVVNNFRYATFSDATLGFGAIRGPWRWNLDLNVSKTTRITERLSTRFDAQFVNAFNHFMMGSGSDSYFSFQPGADLSNPKPFGVPSNQFNAPRYIQFGLRFDF